MPRKSIGDDRHDGRRTPGPLPRRARGGGAGDPHASPSRSSPPSQRRLRRARRWHDAVVELTELQAQYVAWRDALPANLQDSALADALQAICDLDLTELQAIDPPRGFGRD